MIKAIIFDCFGVLTGDNWLAFRNTHFEHDTEKLNAVNELNKQYDNGKLDFKKFVNEVCKIANIDADKAYINLVDTPPNIELFDYIKNNLKPNYKLGLLSNVGDNWLNDIFTIEQNELFDAIALSYQIGHSKPDHRAYEAIVSKLDVEPREAIFIDDQPKYVIGASEFGLNTVNFKTTKQAISELELLISQDSQHE